MKRLFCLILIALCIPLVSHAQKRVVDNTTRETVRFVESVPEPEPKPEKLKKPKKPLNIKYQGEVNVGYTVSPFVIELYHSSEYYKTDRILLNTVHGARFSKYLFVGVGTGLEYATNIGEFIIPFFVNIKGYCPIKKDVCSLYFSVSPGYQLGLDSVFYGFGWRSSFGVEYRRFTFDVGFAYSDCWDYYDSNTGSFAMYLGVGFKF